jgi:hypothetical protein
MIMVSWNAREGSYRFEENEAIAKLRFKSLNSTVKASESFRLSNLPLRSEAYGQSLKTMDLKMKFTGSDSDVKYALYQNVPNPFGDKTVVGFDLPHESEAVLTLYDAYGKVVLIKKIEGIRGYNEVVINKADLQTNGVIYYQMDADDFTATKRMVVQ